MRILIGISHPKQVYMFKNLISSIVANGDQYIVVLNDKEISSQLLTAFNITFKKIGVNQKSIFRKILQLFILSFKTMRIALNFKADIFIGQALPPFAYVSFFLRKPFIIFEDTETSTYLQRIVNPFAETIITPHSFRNSLGKKQIRIKGGYELAYLSKKYFIPDKKIFKYLDLEMGEKFVIIRFVSWNANHDIGHAGISTENKIKVVKSFEKYAKVFITSECALPKELEPYRFSISPVLMHHAIYYSTMVYGESATMAAEAAYLGTPAIFLDNEGRGYTDELEKKYKLVFNFSESYKDQTKSISKGIEILSSTEILNWKYRNNDLIEDSIDVNEFMIWFIRNYPESNKIMQENNNYQNRFL